MLLPPTTRTIPFSPFLENTFRETICLLMYSGVTVIIFGIIIDILGLNKKTFRAPTWSPDKMIIGNLFTQRLQSQVDCRFYCVHYSIYFFLIDDIRISITDVLYFLHIINCSF